VSFRYSMFVARIGIVAFALMSVWLSGPASGCSGGELKTHHVTIVYPSWKYLSQFEEKISAGNYTRDSTAITLDSIIRRVETLLEMFPRDLKFTIVLLPTSKDVQRVYAGKYGRSPDYIAFYSPCDNTVFLSVRDLRVGVLAHELSHVVVDKFFRISPPYKIHELLAQYVETHFDDVSETDPEMH
jgi:hypothetical protein